MSETKRATRSANELWELYAEEEIEAVEEEHDASWRHGTYTTTTVKDAEGRFWQGTYCVSGDGEENYWRDGFADDFYEVFPVTKTITTYE